MRLIINDVLPMRGLRAMEVYELRQALDAFKPESPIVAAIPQMGQPHRLRALHLAGHIDHPGEVKTDHTVHALDIMTDAWDEDLNKAEIDTIGALIDNIAPYPDQMHVRLAVPVAHESMSHRMLDIVMVGLATGAAAGIQIITENWDNPYQVIKTIQNGG
jgi:hypothetical protein